MKIAIIVPPPGSCPLSPVTFSVRGAVRKMDRASSFLKELSPGSPADGVKIICLDSPCLSYQLNLFLAMSTYLFLYMNISIDLHNSVNSSQVRKLGMSLEDEGGGEGRTVSLQRFLQSSEGCLSSA